MFNKLRVKFLNVALVIWVVRYIVPKIRFSWGYCKITGKQYHKGYEILEPGDILLSIDYARLSSLLVPGEFTHGAVCVNNKNKPIRERNGFFIYEEDDYEIAEMMAGGFTKSTFFDFCREADRVMILRPKFSSDQYKQRFIATCRAYEGEDYDFIFDLGNRSLYCFELIYASDFMGELGIEIPKNGILVSESILYCVNNGTLEKVWDSDDN